MVVGSIFAMGNLVQKDKFYCVHSARFVTGLAGSEEGGAEITLTLSAGSLWWGSEHSLPPCKDTNAQQLHPKEDCSEFLSRQQSMEELLGKVVNFTLARIRMLT